MALDAGSVAVKVGANFSSAGYDRWDRANAKAKAEARRPITQTLAADADEAGFDRWHRASVKARLEARRPIEQKMDLDTGSYLLGLAAARRGTALLTKESSSLGNVFNRSNLSIGQWTGIIAAAAPIVIQLGAALGALTASLAAAVGGLGALATGVAGAVTVGFGGIAAIAAPAIKSLQDLMTAQTAAHKAQITGAGAAGRASASAAQQMTAANDQVATATRGVTTAEEQLKVAEDAEGVAQKALTQARKDAVRELQDMHRAAIEGAANEESARIALRRAEESLNQVLRDSTSTNLDIREAENGVTLARQNLRDVTIQAHRDQQDYNTAQKKGIDQMPGVVAAQQGLDGAIRSVHTAQQGVAQAHRDVAKALQNLTYQQKQANTAAGAGATQMAALALAERKAGPAAVAFANNLRAMGREWHGLTAAGRNQFFGILNDGLDRLNSKLPMLARSANTSMAALRVGFNRFLDRATGPEFNRFIHVMTQTFAQSMRPLGDIFGNIAKILERIAVAVGPDVVRVIRQLRDITDGWVASTRNAGQLRDVIHGLVNQTETWAKLIGQAAQLVLAVLIPGMGSGKRAVEGVTATLKEWTDWVNAHPKEMRDFFKQGLETTRELLAILLPLIDQIYVLGQAMLPVSKAFLDVTKWLNSIKVGNISALTGLLGAFLAFKGGRAAVGAFEDIQNMIPKLRNGLQRVRGLIETVALRGMYAAEAASNWVSNIAGGIRSGSGKVRDAIRRALSATRTFVTSAATGAAEFVGSMVGSIRSSRLATRLRTVFEAVAARMGAVMATTIAAAMATGEAIGGAAASLPAMLRGKLNRPMRLAGRSLGITVGEAIGLGILLALPAFSKPIQDWIDKHVPGAGGILPGGGESGLHYIESGGPFRAFGGGQTGGVVTDRRIQYMQAGGPVRGTDTAGPFMLTPGEVVVDRPTVQRQGGPAQLLGSLRAGGMAGLVGFAKGASDEGKRGAEGFRKALDEGSKKAKAIATDLRKKALDEFDQIRKGTLDSTDKLHDGSVKDFDDLHDKSVDSTRDMHRKVSGEYDDLERDHDQQLRQMQGNVRQRFGAMSDTAKQDSAKLTGSVRGSMRSVSGVVFQGMSYIAKATNKALGAFNVKPVHLNLDAPKLRQAGGHLAGGRTGDRNILLAEDDEYVLNRNVTRGLGKDYLDYLNFKVFPRQHGGGIDRSGGMTAMIAEANKFEQRHFPYLWGGGHGSFGIQPVDCSGAVSDVLHAAGLLNAPLTSTGLMSWGKPGRGPLTVWSGPNHVVMGLNGRIFGTSGTNPRGGAGWIEGVRDGKELVLPTGGPVATRTMDVAGAASRIGKLVVRGLAGPMRDLDQASVDMARAAGNRYIASKAPGGAFGGGQKAPKGGWTRVGATYEGLDGAIGGAGVPVGGKAFAELLVQGQNQGMYKQDLAATLGLPNRPGMGMPYGTKLAVRMPGANRSFTMEKNDVGSGQAGNAHFKVDLQTGIARALGWHPNQDVEVSRLQHGGLVGGRTQGPGRVEIPPMGVLRDRLGNIVSQIPEGFDDLFAAIGAGVPGAIEDAEAYLRDFANSPAGRHARGIEAKMAQIITNKIRAARADHRDRLARIRHERHRAAQQIHGHGSHVHRRMRNLNARIARERRAARQAEQKRLDALYGRRRGIHGLANRRIESALEAGYGQLSSFEDARHELFGTFGGNAGGGFGGGGDSLGIEPSPAGSHAGQLLGGPVSDRGARVSQDGFGNTRIIEGGVTVNNYFRESPREPHIWARSTMYELRAAT